MIQTKKIGFSNQNKISSLPWESLLNLHELEKDAVDIKLSPFTHSTSVLNQVLAFLASPAIPLVKNDSGKYSITLTMQALKLRFEADEVKFLDGVVCTKSKFTGIMKFLTIGSRGAIIPKTVTSQLKPDGLRYNASVPLFLSSFKEYRNIKYADWDLSDPNMKHVVDRYNLSVFEFIGTEFGWDAETLKTYSIEGRKFKTGARAGTVKHINSAYSISAVGDKEFDELPTRVKVLLCQTWCYQPEFYTPFSIVNLSDVDAPASTLPSVDDLFAKQPEEDTLW